MKKINNLISSYKFALDSIKGENKRHEELTALLREQNSLIKGLSDQTQEANSTRDRRLGELLATAKWLNRISDVTRIASLSQTYSEINSVIETRQLSMLDTVKSIAENNLSFARMGDGEFKLMLRPNYDIKFQTNSPELARELKHILTEKQENLLLGIPQVFQDMFWSHMWADVWPQLGPLLSDYKGSFANAHVTRPPFFTRHQENAVSAWREVWSNRDALVVAGSGSRFEIIPELFDNLNSIERIDSLAQHAYSDLGRIEDILSHRKIDLVLVALGPAGTVLTSRLANKGIQALDIGHLSASWESVFMDTPSPEDR